MRVSGENKVHASDSKLCGAKTRSGAPCKNYAMANGRCRMHGGKSTGPKDKDKVKKNKNAVTTGEHETIWLDALEEEEQTLFTKIDTREIEQINNEIKLTDIRLRRMLQRIKKLQQENISLSELKEGIDKGQETSISVYEDNMSKIQNIEEAITRIQANKRQLIETKLKLSGGTITTSEDKLGEMMEGILDAVDS